MNTDKKPNLRDRQQAATREQILDVAMEILTGSAASGFSHESIAMAAGMGARTVYRHFPDRAELLQALWLRLRAKTNTRFPSREDEIALFLRSGFRSFDEHESLVRAILNSAAGTEVRERGGVEGRAAFARSLEELLAARSAAERAKIIAVFVAIYSAPFWQLLRDRGQLTGAQAGDAGAWLVEVLLNELRRSRKRGKHARTNKKKQ